MISPQEELLPIELRYEMSKTEDDSQEMGDAVVPLWLGEGMAVISNNLFPCSPSWDDMAPRPTLLPLVSTMKCHQGSG